MYYRKLFGFSFYFSKYRKHLFGKIQIDKRWLREFKSTEKAKASHSKQRNMRCVCVCLYKTGSVAHVSQSGLASKSTLLPLPPQDLGLEAHTTKLGSYIYSIASAAVWVGITEVRYLDCNNLSYRNQNSQNPQLQLHVNINDPVT